ncbi:isoprenyl transferase [Falsochrobactrum sp. TDYN1]|uniref:Isoprenyl transferase n=2 Tax=Falsochrobactrum tianjinense TaxID=2706015 RepID=A0A949PPS7_9HYPH|nr:isoprenyl transferase [Falsochrobactrum sp. TDYN1]MBV2144602.1 isoprenyl transferase [Falsochrobactrum sp. TDYN1]
MRESSAMSDPRHIAIIMDGNGRWAKARGLPRSAGHRAGVEALRNVVRAAGDRGLGFLTLFAFSSENWSRPSGEVGDLMGLLKLFIRRDLAELHRNNVCVRIIGEREGLAADIRSLLGEAEALTRRNGGLNLIIAFNYGARDEIVRAVQSIGRDIAAGLLDPSSISSELISANLDTAGIPDPDLIIRTSGEMRLSNFLLWQAAYSEFLFVSCHWPDFTSTDLDAAYEAFRQRERRYGGIEQGKSEECETIVSRPSAKGAAI